MNKTARIIVVVLILLILGGAAFYFFGKSSTNPFKSAQNQISNMTSGKKSLMDFFSMSGSLKCTFADKTENSSGTVYVGAGKMHGDFQSSNGGTESVTHMINDGTSVYIWTDGQKNGYKMSLAAVKQEASQPSSGNASGGDSGSQASPGGMNMQKQSDYSCGPWVSDATLFSVPQDITFSDFSSMMQQVVTPQGQGITSQEKQNACSQCNQVPAGAMRNQCLSALKCQ